MANQEGELPFSEDDFQFLSFLQPSNSSSDFPQLGLLEVENLYSASATYYGGGWVITNSHALDLEQLPRATIKFKGHAVAGKHFVAAFKTKNPDAQLTGLPDLCWIHFPSLENSSLNGLAHLNSSSSQLVTAHHYGVCVNDVDEDWNQGETSTVSEGKIIGRKFSNSPIPLLTHTASTYPGASGGPLIDSTTKNLVGIHVGGRVTDPTVNYALDYKGVRGFVGDPKMLSIIASIGTLKTASKRALYGMPVDVKEIANKAAGLLKQLAKEYGVGLELRFLEGEKLHKMTTESDSSCAQSCQKFEEDSVIYKQMKNKLWENKSSKFKITKIEGYFGGPQHITRVGTTLQSFIVAPTINGGTSIQSISDRVLKSAIRRYIRQENPGRKELPRGEYPFPEKNIKMLFPPGQNDFHFTGSSETFEAELRDIVQKGGHLEIEYLKKRAESSESTTNINEKTFGQYLYQSYQRNILHAKDLIALLTRFEAFLFAGIHTSRSDDTQHITLQIHTSNAIHLRMGEDHFKEFKFWQNVEKLE